MLFEFGNKIKKKEGENCYFWVNKNLITKMSLRYYGNSTILKPLIFNYLTDLINFVIQLFFFIKKKFSKLDKIKNNSRKKKINFKKYKTIFFTTGGIVTANSNYLSYKNFFFSDNKNSLLYSKNFLISEISKGLDTKSLSYFKKLKLKFFYWHNKRVIKLHNNEIYLFLKIIFKLLFLNDLKASVRICWSLLEIKSNIKILENIPNLKNAIIDNEFQTPVTLAIALKHKRIKINCIAKRLIYM